jgi:hypothetical protein
VLTLQQSDEIAAYILSLRGNDPQPYHSVANSFEANGEELLRLSRWRTSRFTGTVACSGLDNQESDPSSPFRS